MTPRDSRGGRLPAAVLWDMDGTLVDTEPYWMAAEHALVAEFGGTWTDADGASLVGNPLLISARVIRERGSVDLPDEAIVARLVEHVTRAVVQDVPWQPGARELLEELAAADIPCALVTMSYVELAAAVVQALPEGSFSTLVTGDVVTHGKPHPEPYLTAAARLGVRPEDCIALEDSPPGLESAAAAGCRVVGIPHIVPLEPAPGRVIVPTLDGLDLHTLAAIA
ncbi:MAG TPA: HAD family phosphatase [Actinomycetes bacterium]|nr:HAD family phosphatase [Actinomycetes bacterium]